MGCRRRVLAMVFTVCLAGRGDVWPPSQARPDKNDSRTEKNRLVPSLRPRDHGNMRESGKRIMIP